MKSNKELVEEIIKTIEEEINKSCSSIYFTKEDVKIITDTGYIYDWFEDYKKILRKRYE